ncbi:MAG: GNAT family N-acetyltransferase [Solibacillus sp.]
MILPYEKKYAAQIATLLNNFLPFEPETVDTVHNAGGLRFLYVNEADEVIGYIAGHKIKDYEANFPYFKRELNALKLLVTKDTTYYTSHFVVHPNARRQGIGTQLVDMYTSAASRIAKTIVTVGWVQSDTNNWAAEHQFKKAGFEPFVYMPRYFEPYSVDCPSCGGLCHCDAHIFIK